MKESIVHLNLPTITFLGRVSKPAELTVKKTKQFTNNFQHLKYIRK